MMEKLALYGYTGYPDENRRKVRIESYDRVTTSRCVVCGENKILAVHHMNENKKDNRPENLIPLCPTHHQYFHSKYRHEVEPIILNYIANLSVPTS